MKRVYVNIGVLGCMLQILIGSSYELLNALPCSPILICGINEQSKKNDDQSFSCNCLPNAYRNHTTQQCILKYQWVEYTSELFGDSRLVYTDVKDPHFVIVRLIYNNGSIAPYEGYVEDYIKAITPDPPLKNVYKRYEVLLAKSANHYKWVQSSNGTVEKNAILGGQINHEKVYVCRVNMEDVYYIGVMQSSKRTCYAVLWRKYHSTYELLIYKI
ncbi:hypothetical protein PV327_001851 [Microctonus hyperodae]|uniref:Uncharacterized protein n=1 Tax=Microctonus hyperodae TaxID=165561 RepID=A0AA39KNJ9_MICHY|nr:hypothetical protein PV327_001851 [Microctonus hyperodae]